MKSAPARCAAGLRRAWPNLLVAAAFGLSCVPLSACAGAAPVEAQFRGCESAGWCRFWIEAPEPSGASVYRVRPDGISTMPCDDATGNAVRDRLNALLASMIHQHKRIVLHDLRELDDGTFAAAVTVNGQALAADPVLIDLRDAQCPTGSSR